MCRAMPHPAWDDVFAHVSHAFYPRRTELEGAFRAPVQGQGDPPAAVSWRSGCGISPIKYVPRLIAYASARTSL